LGGGRSHPDKKNLPWFPFSRGIKGKKMGLEHSLGKNGLKRKGKGGGDNERNGVIPCEFSFIGLLLL